MPRFEEAFLARATISLFLAGVLALSAGPALAHPHVWVKARAQVVFGADGKIAAIRHVWTFDEMYSAFALQGLGKDGQPSKEELAALAKTNMESLVEFQYFTAAKTGAKYYEFAEPGDAEVQADDKKLVTLRFTLPLKEPVEAKKPFTFMIYDPTFFVDFELADEAAVTLANAPSGCSISTLKPGPLNPLDNNKLNESAQTGMAPGQDFGLKLAARSIVVCP